jgi:type IV secretory pathway component VirB8
MILASSIYMLLPMIEVKPRFFRINEQFNRIDLMQPREIRVAVSDLITEQNIRDYMTMRYTITDDYSENEERWSTDSALYWMSTSNVFGDFERFEKNAALQQFKKTGLQRYINIDWIKPLSFGLWQTQFTTMEYIPGHAVPQTAQWLATMRIIYAAIPFQKKEDRELNPFGFLVATYSLAYNGHGQVTPIK